MNNLSKVRVNDLFLLFAVLKEVLIENEENWTELSQKDVFDLVTSKCKKKINPSLIQREVERLEQFQLPRNVDDQHVAMAGDS